MKLVQRRIVLLPEPLAPIIAMRSPRLTSRSTPLITCRSPKRLCRLRMRMTISLIGVSREGPPRPTDQPPGGQRAERAWGDVHPSREGPPRPTDQPPGGQRAERAWGDVPSPLNRAPRVAARAGVTGNSLDR